VRQRSQRHLACDSHRLPYSASTQLVRQKSDKASAERIAYSILAQLRDYPTSLHASCQSSYLYPPVQPHIMLKPNSLLELNAQTALGPYFLFLLGISGA